MTEKPRWPTDKSTRFCNLGDCPAFHLTPADMEFLNETTRLIKVEGWSIERVVREKGMAFGTCLVKAKRVLAASACSVDNIDFLDYFKEG